LNTLTIRRTATIILIQIVLVLSGPWAVLGAESQGAQGERVAVVNGVEISRAEFNVAVKQAKHQLAGPEEKVSGTLLQKIRKEAMENLIGRRLAYQESLRLGISIESILVDKEIERVRNRFSSDQQLEEALDKTGLSLTQLRLQFEQDLAIRQVLEEQVIRNIKVADREIREFYDHNPNLFKTPAMVKASHLFIEAGPEATKKERKQAVALIRDIQEKLAEGAEFAEMAIDYSLCPTSENGGDLGYFEKDKMIKGFAEEAFALNPGEISDIVRTSQGYHLIKVDDRQPKMKLAFEDVKEKLLQNLKIEKSKQEMKAYLKTLRDFAEVEIFIHL
jgi:peptidyl-prolyl cis-trans isomerase C